jgi:hypothetical protein
MISIILNEDSKMKKICGVFGIAVLFMIPILATPTLALRVEENDADDLEINWKMLIVIGRITVCFEDKVISGFALIGYTDGETLIMERINIEFAGIPIFINNGLLFSFCFYKPANSVI